MQYKRIALFGFFGWGNLGNTGTLQAFLHHLRDRLPEAEISCVCANPEDVANRFQIPVFPIDLLPRQVWHKPANPILRLLHQGLLRVPLEVWLWLKAFLFVQSIDLLMIPGTGVLDDFGVGPFQTPYDLFKWCLLAKLSGTKLLFVSVGAGPILHSVSRWFMKSALSLADYRSYRDEFSREYMKSIGFGLEDNGVYPDLMFSLPLPTTQQATTKRGAPRVVGVGVMEYYGWHTSAGYGATSQGEEIYQRYITKLGQFVVWLMEQAYTVRIIIGQTHDQRAVNDLKTYVENAYRERGNAVVTTGQLISETIATTEDLFQQIATTDIVVASRFHNVLCALMLNTPVISLGYAKKNDVLMVEMGLGHYCQPIETFEVDPLITQFSTLAEQADQVCEQIQRKNMEYRQALNEQYEFITQDM